MHLGALGGGPGAVLGGPGVVREGLRASWEGLGRSWSDLGATFKAVRFRIYFLLILSAERVPKGRPLGSQNGG